MASLQDYNQNAVSWRAVLESNSRRTQWVIFSFIALYLTLGLLVDALYYYTLQHNVLPDYYRRTGVSGAEILALLGQLITFQKTPYATLIMGTVAIISIVVTYAMYDRIMLFGTDSHEVTADPAQSLQETQLYNVVEEMRIAAGIGYTPRVYLINADYMNAFASGVSEKSAMIAITSGLLNKLDRAELQAVIAHELSHILHMDIKLTLVATVLSNIMLLVIDFLFRGILYSDRRKIPPQLLFAILALRIILPILTMVLLLFLSRTREYMADAGAVELTRDNGPLASALIKIHQDTQTHSAAYNHDYQLAPNESVRRSAYLYDPTVAGVRTTLPLTSLFSTHPPLEARLNAIGYKRKREDM